MHESDPALIRAAAAGDLAVAGCFSLALLGLGAWYFARSSRRLALYL